jgi:hypothetical protein
MWLYIPTISPSSTPAPATECSERPPCSDLNASASAVELFVTLSGIAQRRPLSWPGWRRRPWIKHLLPTISRPLMADRGADSWISFVRDCRANRTPPQENGSATVTAAATERMATAQFPTSCESWKSVAPPWSGSKTCQPGLWGDSSDQLEKSYAEWVTRSKTRSSSLRQTLALRMSGRGSLSSRTWPTVAATDSTGARNSTSGRSDPNSQHHSGEMLNDAIRNWPSARAEDSESAGNHPKATDSLTGVTRNWPTTSARDEKGPNGENHFQTKDRPHEDQLANASRNWATPVSQPANGTPEAFVERKRRAIANGSQMGLTLSDLQLQTINWATATTHDSRPRGAGNRLNPAGGAGSLTSDAIDFPCSLLAAETNQTPITPTGGLGLLLQRWTPPECRALNPAFQWWLMGWPVLTSSESVETAWFRWRRQSLSLLNFLTCLENR